MVLPLALAAPAGAATVNHESYSMSGVTAEAFFDSGEQEPAVGTPQVLYVMGADATTVHRVPGARPERTPQPALLALGLMMPGTETGDEPYQAELWCASDAFTFTVADDLAGAELQIPTCDAVVVVYDPETGEEMPNGVTVTLSATVTWTATGPLESQRSHSRYDVGGSWTMESTRTALRPATADLTLTGLPGGTYVSTSTDATLQVVKNSTLIH